LSSDTANKVSKALAWSNVSDISAETLLAAFKAEGIASLEDLVQHMTQALQDSRGLPSASL
jgi:hypothetical protein